MRKTSGTRQSERWCLGFLAGIVSLGFTACAAERKGAGEPEVAPAAAPHAMPASQAQPGSGGEEFQDIAQATEAFDLARRELDELTLAMRDEPAAPSSSDAMGSAAMRSEATAPSAPKAAAPRASASVAASDEASQREKKADSEQSRCERICRALGSMERATNGICRILGAQSERCQSAHEDLSRSQGRAATCACSRP